jgi:hypothetical protein
MMSGLSAWRLGACVALLTGFAQAASAAEILIVDEKSSPESLTLARDGTLIVGSASTPFVYKVRPGSTIAEKFVDASAEGSGTFFLGMLADGNTVWTCQLTPVPGTRPAQRHTALRGFDISTGAEKLRWKLPGDNTTCNDFPIGPDKALYISDTSTGKIYKLPAGASRADLFLEDTAALRGIDGLTFLNGTLYVNNVITSIIYRIPVDAGKAGQPVEISLDQPIKGPDGMRAANGKIFVAENGSGKISVITVTGDKGSVTVIKEGLKTPIAVEPAGDTLWVAERGAGKAVSMPMPK